MRSFDNSYKYIVKTNHCDEPLSCTSDVNHSKNALIKKVDQGKMKYGDFYNVD